MTFKITKIIDAGSIDKERIVLRAQSDTDVGSCLLLGGEAVGPDRVSSGDMPFAYWFEDKPVKAKDLVVLYTKSGQNREKENENGTTSHFFYVGRDESLWGSRLRPALINSEDWSIFES